MQTDKRVAHWLPNKPNSGHEYCLPAKKVAHTNVFVRGTLVNVVAKAESKGILVAMKGETTVVVGERMPS